MSGPFCNTCKHFRPAPLNEGNGECGDPTKAIIARGGNRVGEPPFVRPDYTCRNHAPSKVGYMGNVNGPGCDPDVQ